MRPQTLQHAVHNASFDWQAWVDAKQGRKEGRFEYLFVCPRCQHEKLSVNPTRQRWRCFVCARGGADALSLVTWMGASDDELSAFSLDESDLSAVRCILHEDAGAAKLARPLNWKAAARPEPKMLPLSATYQHSVFVRLATDYAYYRGITPEAIAGMRLHVGISGRYVARLIFPVYDVTHGGLLFFQARDVTGQQEKKIIGPAATETLAGSGDVLLNYETILTRKFRRVALVEGPVDCAHAWPDAVGLWGKVISDRHLRLLYQAGVKEVDVLLDPDVPEATRDRLLHTVMDLFVTRLVELPEGKDPGSLPKREIEQLRNAAPVIAHYGAQRLLRCKLR